MARTCSPAAMQAAASTIPRAGGAARQDRTTGRVPRVRNGVRGASRTSCSYASPTVRPSIQCTGRSPLSTARSFCANSSCGVSRCGRRTPVLPGLRWSPRPAGPVVVLLMAAAPFDTSE